MGMCFVAIHCRQEWHAHDSVQVAFQLLCALNFCHQRDVFHGDVKIDNVLLTSWNWVVLTDFASFKPTFLPEVSSRGQSGTDFARTILLASRCFSIHPAVGHAALHPNASTLPLLQVDLMH